MRKISYIQVGAEVRPRWWWGRRAAANDHRAQVLAAEDWGGWYPYSWRCSCLAHGQPEHTEGRSRRDAQTHVNHPQRS